MNDEKYGPLAGLAGVWESEGHSGENQAPDPDRKIENTMFRQKTVFKPIADVENHEQVLAVLRYSTEAWEEGDDEEPFHEEVGYWIWDAANKQILKSFIVPRGIAVNAGGTCETNAKSFSVHADLASETYGLCSNLFLDQEFKTLSYDLKIDRIDEHTFSYDENTRIQIKGQDKVFDHTEKNVMRRV